MQAIQAGKIEAKMMNKNPVFIMAIISAIVAFVVVVVLKIIGHEYPTVIGGTLAGGVVGALSITLFRKKESLHQYASSEP